MLKIYEISKSYIQRGIVLDKLSMEVADGASVAITGPSGSGKTTLMNIIGLIDKPDSGDIWFRERAILDYSTAEAAAYRNREIGFVFQDHLLLPHLTVFENIILPVFAHRPDADELAEKREFVSMLLEKAGIGAIKNSYPFNISGGEAQRAAVIRALVNRPSLLLADEPTGSLDARNASQLADILLMMNKELRISMIVTTHSQELASRMNVKYKLENGRLST